MLRRTTVLFKPKEIKIVTIRIHVFERFLDIKAHVTNKKKIVNIFFTVYINYFTLYYRGHLSDTLQQHYDHQI